MASYLILFILGLNIGSFLNCIIYRLYTSESFLLQRSHCPKCQRVLGWQDLIPVLSFALLRGKCRYCKGEISWQYPLVELATGILFTLIFYHFQWDVLRMSYAIIISCFLIVIFVYDFKHYLIPDKVIYPAVGIAFLWYLASGFFLKAFFQYEMLNTFYATLAVSAFFFSIFLVSHGKWMGLGDAKLALLMGLFLGWPGIAVAVFFAFFSGAIMGLGLVALHKKDLSSEVPFAPFLITGTFIALFLGEELVRWYLNYFVI